MNYLTNHFEFIIMLGDEVWISNACFVIYCGCREEEEEELNCLKMGFWCLQEEIIVENESRSFMV